MIGHLGETSIAAVGLANQYYLMFFLTTSAVCVGGSVLISQFWGKKEIFNIKKFAGIGLILSLLSAVFFTSIALIFPEFIIGTTSAVCVGGSVLISQFWGKKEIFNIKKFAGIGLILSLLSAVFFTSIALIFPEFIIGLFDKNKFWGKKEIFNIKKFAGIGLILSLLSAVFFTSIALIFPEFIIGLFDKNKDVISTGSAYLRAVAPSYIFTCLSFNFCATLRSTGVSLTIFLFLENLELSHLELLELPLVQLLQDL